MGIHFPADHNIFACVEQEAYKYTPESNRARGKVDGLLAAQSWLRMFHSGFWMSAEGWRNSGTRKDLESCITSYEISPISE